MSQLQNWCQWVVYWREDEHQLDVLQSTNSTDLVALLKDVPMDCSAVVLPETLLKRQTVKCLPFRESTRQPIYYKLFHYWTVSRYWHKNQQLAEKDSVFSIYSTIKWTDSTLISSKESIWTIVKLLMNLQHSRKVYLMWVMWSGICWMICAFKRKILR